MVVHGIHFPEGETHLTNFEEIVETGCYQLERLSLSVQATKQRKRCIDVGGHVGLWSMHLVKFFDTVEAFEPIKAHRDCFVKNVKGNYNLHPYALGNHNGEVSFHIEKENTGHTHIGEGDQKAEIKKLDDFNFDDVGFIKIDTEGYELFVCEGAVETIKRCSPVICVEQKNHGYFVEDHLAAIKFLGQLGYEVLHKIHGDYICVRTS